MLYYDEVFLSIQGEAARSGLPTVFIRLYGCPIGCSYCDQPQDRHNCKRVSLEHLVGMVYPKYKWAKHICITGGEPMVQEDTLPLVYELRGLGFDVSIETSGCVPLEHTPYRRSYSYVMDVKCPSSGVGEKNVYENLLFLQRNDEVKYVLKDREDYDFMRGVMKKYPTLAAVLVSPMFSEWGLPYLPGSELVEWVLEDHLDCRVMVQLHKVLKVK